jgi:hypothetical protein
MNSEIKLLANIILRNSNNLIMTVDELNAIKQIATIATVTPTLPKPINDCENLYGYTPINFELYVESNRLRFNNKNNYINEVMVVDGLKSLDFLTVNFDENQRYKKEKLTIILKGLADVSQDIIVKRVLEHILLRTEQYSEKVLLNGVNYPRV